MPKFSTFLVVTSDDFLMTAYAKLVTRILCARFLVKHMLQSTITISKNVGMPKIIKRRHGIWDEGLFRPYLFI